MKSDTITAVSHGLIAIVTLRAGQVREPWPQTGMNTSVSNVHTANDITTSPQYETTDYGFVFSVIRGKRYDWALAICAD